MKELKKEKEISIFKKIKNILKENNSIDNKFRDIAAYFEDEKNISVYFCEIIGGRRWSYLKGAQHAVAPNKKIKITDNYGIIINQYNKLDNNKWDKIIDIIRKDIQK